MKFLRESAIAVATLGPLGKLPAPGTWGSAAGIALYAVGLYGYELQGRWMLIALAGCVAVLFATFICHLGELFLKKKDPGCIILDEFVAMPLVFLGFAQHLKAARHVWAWYLAGFLLFRLFDISKPFGIRALQRVGGGFGIVVDDLLAAVYAGLCLHAAHWLVGYLR